MNQLLLEWEFTKTPQGSGATGGNRHPKCPKCRGNLGHKNQALCPHCNQLTGFEETPIEERAAAEALEQFRPLITGLNAAYLGRVHLVWLPLYRADVGSVGLVELRDALADTLTEVETAIKAQKTAGQSALEALRHLSPLRDPQFAFEDEGAQEEVNFWLPRMVMISRASVAAEAIRQVAAETHEEERRVQKLFYRWKEKKGDWRALINRREHPAP